MLLFPILHYVALFWGAVFVRIYLKRLQHHSPPMGRRRRLRMQRCCPMIARRAELQIIWTEKQLLKLYQCCAYVLIPCEESRRYNSFLLKRTYLEIVILKRVSCRCAVAGVHALVRVLFSSCETPTLSTHLLDICAVYCLGYVMDVHPSVPTWFGILFRRPAFAVAFNTLLTKEIRASQLSRLTYARLSAMHTRRK